MSDKVALITGVTGQDGSLLARLLLDKGYVGGGASGRNTAIIRSNYLTPEGVRFCDRSVTLYAAKSAEDSRPPRAQSQSQMRSPSSPP